MKCLTYRDMLKVLSKFVRPSNDLPLGDPLFDVIDLLVEGKEPGGLLKASSPLLSKILQTGIQLVNLRLTDCNLVTVGW